MPLPEESNTVVSEALTVATLGKEGSTRIPGGPIVFEDLVLVEVKIQGKYYICIERIDTLQPC